MACPPQERNRPDVAFDLSRARSRAVPDSSSRNSSLAGNGAFATSQLDFDCSNPGCLAPSGARRSPILMRLVSRWPLALRQRRFRAALPGEYAELISTLGGWLGLARDPLRTTKGDDTLPGPQVFSPWKKRAGSIALYSCRVANSLWGRADASATWMMFTTRESRTHAMSIVFRREC